MFLGCSEISICVTVKHEQHIGIIRAFCLSGGRSFLNFSVSGVHKKFVLVVF